MMNKTGKSTYAESTFVASVPLEIAIQLIGSIADDEHQITLTEVTENVSKFQIRYLPYGKKSAEVDGKLHRWNNDETRIEAKVKGAFYIDDSIFSRWIRATFGAITFLVVMWIFRGLPVVFTPIFIGLSALIVWFFSPLRIKSMRKSHATAIRVQDYLLQRLIELFKTTGTLETFDSADFHQVETEMRYNQKK